MIYLHIGNGKAGSTTIQSFLEHNRGVLEQNCVTVPDVDIFKLSQVLSSPRADEVEQIEALTKIRSVVKEKSAATIVFSCEFLFAVRRSQPLELLRSVISDHAVRIIIYLREYPGWIVSSYNQTIKNGKTASDFDAYFKRKIDITSVMPAIEPWADVFGRDHLHIRSIDSPALAGGKLTVDFAKAIGVDRLRGLELDVPTKNTSEDWCSLEIRRALAAELQDLPVHERSAEFARLARWIRRLMPDDVKKELYASHPAQYLTPSQWRVARDLYNSDMSRIRSEFPGSAVSDLNGGEPREREFLPGIEHVPARVKEGLAGAVKRAKARKLLPAGDAEVFELILTKGEDDEEAFVNRHQTFTLNPLERRELDGAAGPGPAIFLSGPRKSPNVKITSTPAELFRVSLPTPAKYVFSEATGAGAGFSPEVFVAAVEEGRVATNRFIVAGKGAEVIAETVPRNARAALNPDGPERALSRKLAQPLAARLFRPLASRMRSSLAGPCLHSIEEPAALVGQANNNYGHWHMDVLSSVGLMQTLGMDRHLTFITSNLIPYRRRSLELMGVNFDRVREIRPNDLEGSHLHCRRLMIPSLISVNYGHVPPWQQTVYDRIRVAVLRDAKDLTVSLPKKIYVDRSNVSKRKCLNEPELAERLRSRGFTIIEPQRLSYDEQVLAFAKADVIVGCMGAGMMNVVFAERGASVIEVVPPGFHKRHLWKKFATMAGAHYRGLLVAPVDGEDEHQEHWRIPDVDALSAEILRLA